MLPDVKSTDVVVRHRTPASIWRRYPLLVDALAVVLELAPEECERQLAAYRNGETIGWLGHFNGTVAVEQREDRHTDE